MHLQQQGPPRVFQLSKSPHSRQLRTGLVNAPFKRAEFPVTSHEIVKVDALLLLHRCMQDVAVITLATPITNLPFAERVTANPATGTQITLVGYGSSGTGSNGSGNDDDIRRIATNILDEIDTVDRLIDGNRFHSDGENAFIFDFDDPLTPGDSQTGSSTALALEGAAGGGDSGGALWATIDGKRMKVA